MAPPNPFKKPPFADQGSPDPNTLSLAVGQALNNWEHVESNFAYLFGTFIRPRVNSYAARRAYGAIASARGRKEVIEAVAEVFFRNFNDLDLEEQVRVTLRDYGDAGARRNDLAHGIIGGESGSDGAFLGYFIVPSIWNTNKRRLKSEPAYRYSATEINELMAQFHQLSERAVRMLDQVDELFASSPKKLRERW